MSEVLELQLQHELGRAKNSVQNFLIGKLLVPKVYLDVDWYGWTIDVLAIDRAGVGDIHAVRLVQWEPGHRDRNGYSNFLEKKVSSEIEKFTEFPGQFRYLTVVCPEQKKQRWIPSSIIRNQCLAADGVGRIGLLYLNVGEEDVTVEILLRAERFRSTKEIVAKADRYVTEHTANWEVRDEIDD